VSEREVLTAKGWPELLWSRIGWNHVYTQLCTVFLAGKSPKIRSHTVCIQYFWQGNHHTYGHIRCVYSIFGREITIHTVTYGVYIRFCQPYKCSIMRPKGVKDQEVTHSVMSKDESIDSVISKDDVVSKYEPMMT
jgi:hypothetical protein